MKVSFLRIHNIKVNLLLNLTIIMNNIFLMIQVNLINHDI